MVSFLFLIHIDILISALFDKARLTLGAAYLDPSLSPGDPDLLMAGGALVYMMRFLLGHQAFLAVEPGADAPCLFQIGLVLGGAPVNVTGKQAEVCVDDQRPGKERQDGTLK